jgi:hypothetical protein
MAKEETTDKPTAEAKPAKSEAKPKPAAKPTAKPTIKPAAAKQRKVGYRERHVRAAVKGTSAEDAKAIMAVLVNFPRGVDPRLVAANVGMTAKYSKAVATLNALVASGHARKIGKLYQPTPEGATAIMSGPVEVSEGE